MLEVTRGSVE